MPDFETPDVVELRDRYLAALKAGLPSQRTGPRTLARIEAGVAAEIVRDNHARLDEIDRNATPITATKRGLVLWAELLRVPRKTATAARKAQALEVRGTPGAVVPVGAQLVHASGLRYQVTVAVTLPSGGVATTDIEAVDVGASTRLPAQPSLSDSVANRKVVHILIEYEGPQLILLKTDVADGEYFLGLAADHGKDFDRWIHAPITKLELEALARGGIAMRDVFTGKTAVDIVDYDVDEHPRRVWSIPASKIPKGILPVKDALLPSFVREEITSEFFPAALARDANPASPLFRLVGRPVYENKISFGGLGEVILGLQRLWTAIATMLQIEVTAGTSNRPKPSPHTLLFGAMVPSSFGVELAVIDHDVFERIAAEYTRLVRGSFQENSDERLLTEPPLVLTAYRAYYHLIPLLPLLNQEQVGSGREHRSRSRSIHW